VLKRGNLKDGDDRALVPKPKELEILRENAQTKIRQFRDATQHIADDIAGSRIAENIDPDVCMTEESMVIANQEIFYSDLARWISQLHPLAYRLSVVQLTASNSDGTKQSGTLN
jgi:hypothetical protein